MQTRPMSQPSCITQSQINGWVHGAREWTCTVALFRIARLLLGCALVVLMETSTSGLITSYRPMRWLLLTRTMPSLTVPRLRQEPMTSETLTATRTLQLSNLSFFLLCRLQVHQSMG